MSRILIIAEQTSEGIKKTSLELITAAGKLSGAGGEIHAFTWGPNIGKLQETLGRFGIKKIYEGKGEEFLNYNSEAFVSTLASLCSREKFDYILATANPLGKDLAPRLAAELKAAYISDCTDINADDKPAFPKPILAGQILTDARPSHEGPAVASLRPNVFPAPQESASKTEPATESLNPALTVGDLKTRFKELKKPESQKADLQEANIIVSGGRGIKSPENFKVLQELADVLGAAVGASRAAVDAGFGTRLDLQQSMIFEHRNIMQQIRL
jgi:electron transfer flavoprotein alpha subunit